MNLKYLLVPVVAFALGALSPVILAKGHGKSHGEHRGHENHERHEGKPHHEKNNNHFDNDNRRDFDRGNGKHHRFEHRPHSTALPVPPPPSAVINITLPTPPSVSIQPPTPPRLNVPAPHLPSNPVDHLIDQTAHDARQRAHDRGH